MGARLASSGEGKRGGGEKRAEEGRGDNSRGGWIGEDRRGEKERRKEVKVSMHSNSIS